MEKKLIFVDDCSKNSSYELLLAFPFKSSIKIYKHEKNMGKGAALRKSIEVAYGDIIGLQDADFEYDMDDIPSILIPFLREKADVVFFWFPS